MKTINLAPKANEDLEAIWWYSQKHFGTKKAEEYLIRLTNSFELLAHYWCTTTRVRTKYILVTR